MRHKTRLKSDLVDLLRQYKIDEYTNLDCYTLSDRILKDIEELGKIKSSRVAQR
jgi:hypothetical protein